MSKKTKKDVDIALALFGVHIGCNVVLFGAICFFAYLLGFDFKLGEKWIGVLFFYVPSAVILHCVLMAGKYEIVELLKVYEEQ